MFWGLPIGLWIAIGVVACLVACALIDGEEDDDQ
jgi:hypothetical protein